MLADSKSAFNFALALKEHKFDSFRFCFTAIVSLSLSLSLSLSCSLFPCGCLSLSLSSRSLSSLSLLSLSLSSGCFSLSLCLLLLSLSLSSLFLSLSTHRFVSATVSSSCVFSIFTRLSCPLTSASSFAKSLSASESTALPPDPTLRDVSWCEKD